MSEHYYSEKPSTKSEPRSWQTTIRGIGFSFTTDRGVFSKGDVDFGSRLLVDTFEPTEEIEGPVLDMGCGYGPIGLSVAKIFPDQNVVMVDINERAIELARGNAKKNGISNVEIFQSHLYDQVTGKYSAILTNPPIRAGKDIVFTIFHKAHEYLMTNGKIWVVIQKKQGAPSAEKKLHEIFGNVEVVTRKKGYYILAAQKY